MVGNPRLTNAAAAAAAADGDDDYDGDDDAKTNVNLSQLPRRSNTTPKWFCL